MRCHFESPDRKDAGYVLNTFPIVRRQDEAEFGAYRTRDLILAYMNALAPGDTETLVAGQGRITEALHLRYC